MRCEGAVVDMVVVKGASEVARSAKNVSIQYRDKDKMLM
jgi:hypothetical protein